MKRSFLLAFFILVVCVALMGCNREADNNSSADHSTDDMQLGSGTQSGNYYPLGAALAKIWNDDLEDIEISSQATDASVENVQLMKQGELEMGFTTTGVLNEAYTGTGAFEDNKYEDVRVLSSLYPQVIQIVADKGSDIDSFADFKGKGFVPGATGSATKNISDKILDAYDMNEDDMDTQYVGFSDVTDLMKNKQVAGGQITSGVPTSAVVEMLSTANGKLISLDDDKIQTLTEENPDLFEFTLSKDTYDEQEKDIETVGSGNVIAVPKDLPEDTVYELTKSMWENIDSLRERVSVADDIKLEKAADELADVPLHPGAKKYYEEEGVLED